MGQLLRFSVAGIAKMAMVSSPFLFLGISQNEIFTVLYHCLNSIAKLFDFTIRNAETPQYLGQ
ncbi:MAG: hypothetical protein B2I17_04940 [Thermoplasmatales archaeon B_DKE]|nr:MAG: hypothetical protein B2I17_04940 [Thermoplasmatales archaeon B_DKE]